MAHFERCAHCPTTTSCPDLVTECRAITSGHRRYCDKVNPDHPAYDPAYVDTLCGRAPAQAGVSRGPALATPPDESAAYLVMACDYRGAVVTRASCSCSQTWNCAMGRGDDPTKPFEATYDQCLRCVRGELDAPPEPNEPPQAPGLLRRVGNFAKALVHHVAAGRPRASEADQAARLAICRACPLLVHETLLGEVCSHQACGCSIVEKSSWADQECPLTPPRWRSLVASSIDTQPASERLEGLVDEVPRVAGDPGADHSPGRSQGGAGGIHPTIPTAIGSVDERPVASVAPSDRGAR
jgi:hypothetical protein